MNYESIFLESGEGVHRLHLKRISIAKGGIPVLMVHGMIESGRIFYHESGKGLGSYLAQQGYDVFVADLRGIGLSEPAISSASKHGQTETVCEDIPSLIEFVLTTTQQRKLHLTAHSWGGVYINAALARQPSLIESIYASIYFGSKRSVRVNNPDRWLKINLMWNIIGGIYSKFFGYLDAKRLTMGADNETAKTHAQVAAWIAQDNWIDSDDGFNYQHALQTINLPATWYIAAIDDHSLGHREDMQRFMQECGEHFQRHTLLSQKNGNAIDYDHVSMLTSALAVEDYFPQLLEWMSEHEVNKSSDT